MMNQILNRAGKPLFFILAVSITLTAQAQNATAERIALTPEERQAAIKYFEETRQKVLDSLKDVSEAQWKFKAGPDLAGSFDTFWRGVERRAFAPREIMLESFTLAKRAQAYVELVEKYA